MDKMHYLYGPVPSRRLGISLGVSPIPKKTCNYSCVYCQLGRTTNMTNRRDSFFKLDQIIDEFDYIIDKKAKFDVITIVGEGEPTLYSDLGKLILEIKKRTDKPIAIITNGALLSSKEVRKELYNADIVLPTFDAVNDEQYRLINRPIRPLKYNDMFDGLVEFSKKFKGNLWLEIMLVKGLNDDEKTLAKFKELLKQIKYDRLYINTPVRPPAEADVEAVENDIIKKFVDHLNGISIELLVSEGFHSEIKDDVEAVKSIIKRHPMNQYEIEQFLITRNCPNIYLIMEKLQLDASIENIEYKGYITYRFVQNN